MKLKKNLRWILGGVLLLFGVMGTIEMLTKGYNSESEGILLFGDTFRNLHNAIMLSYLGPVIRIGHIIIGFFYKKYWSFGLLLHLPIAFNIFCIHLIHDLPYADAFFFCIGMLVSVLTFTLIAFESERLKTLIIND